MKYRSVMGDAITNILSRSIIAPFYRQHTGLFLFIFFLLFGTEPTLYQAILLHRYIILGILTNEGFLGVALLTWLIYASRIIHFFHRSISKDSFQFLLQLRGIHAASRFSYLLKMQMMLFAPVWFYFIFVAWIAVVEKHYLACLLIFASIIIICCLSTLLFDWILKAGIGSVISRFRLRWTMPGLAGYLFRFMQADQLMPLIIIKLISFFCLYGLVNIEVNYFEARLLWLVYITILIGHAILIYRNHHFIESRLFFFRNMPVPRLRLFLSLTIVYTVLLVPEMIALKGLWITHGYFISFIWIIAAGPAILLLIHCLLYTEDLSMEAYLQLLFGVWIVLTFFSLSSFKWLIGTVCLLMAMFIFYSGYYRYEKKAVVEKLD